MSIIRAPRPESNFYLLDKQISEDARLGWAARGLLIYLLGKPDHWSVSIQALVNETSDSTDPSGRDRTYTLINQLIAAGYIVRRQGKGEAGKFTSYDYLVSETPQTESPLPAQPDTDQPYTANPTLVSIEDKQGLNEARTESHGSSAPSDDGFETVWKAYPKREGANPRNKAHSAWKARLKEGVKPDDMIAGLLRYQAYCRAKGSIGTEYVMQAQRFFGPSREFENEWQVAGVRSGKPHSRHHGLDDLDYGSGAKETVIVGGF